MPKHKPNPSPARPPKPALNKVLTKTISRPNAVPRRESLQQKKARLQLGKLQQKDNVPSQSKHQRNQQPTIPFSVYDKILLVGEGDLSFAVSLLEDHGASDVLATCFDSKDDMLAKYPVNGSSNMKYIEDAFAIEGVQEQEERILYNIDATKISSYKTLKAKGPFTRIFFNFPHTGGLSTDVNRQVRHNQALLSSFFTSCIPILATTAPDLPDEDIPLPSILVTLFEGEPYTLWNIRDLARSAGLMVERSFRFPAESYPRYRHARTLGVVRKAGGVGDESESAWKGENRPSRMYEFRVKPDSAVAAKKEKKQKATKRGQETSSEEEEE